MLIGMYVCLIFASCRLIHFIEVTRLDFLIAFGSLVDLVPTEDVV